MPYFWYVYVVPAVGKAFDLDGVLWDDSCADTLLDILMWIQQGHVNDCSRVGYES